MAVTEVLTALGSWDLRLKTTTPSDLWDRIDYFGHVALLPGRLDPQQYGDNLLAAAEYVGVIRRRETTGDDRRTKVIEQGYTIGGVGMAMWLGDEDNKGAVYETAVDLTDATFPDTVRALLPASGAVTEGTLYAASGTYGGRHIYETPRSAIQYVCDTVGTAGGQRLSWRVNGDATLDAGPEADLFVTTPRCVISRIPAGVDGGVESIPGGYAVARDVEDFTTRAVLLAEGEGESIATAAADIDPGLNPYKDIHGNALAMTRLVSESDTSVENADARATVALTPYTSTQNEVHVETDNYYIEGSFAAGDYVWAYDPSAGIVDTANELAFRGERINPMRLQVTEKQWPVTAGYTVAYRAPDGTWYNLTDYVEWDGSETVYVTIGDFARPLTSAGTEPVGSRPNFDTSTPDVPVLVEPFVGTAYLDARGFTRARVILGWTAPNNVDGSTVLDGDHFEIRWAIDTDMIYPATWAQISQVRWMDLQTWAQPFAAPDGDWSTMYVAWGESTAQLQDLSPGVGYDVQIRAVDTAGNIGAWGPVTTFVTSVDNIPPSVPAAPSVAASRIAVQVTHQLGKSSGGTFNLESDLHHLEVHVAYEPFFTPTEVTLKAKVSATAGMIQAQIPVVTTVQVEETSARYVRVVAVDMTGNKSGPSDAASATALLIDDAHISDLTVSKVTAGTVSASWVLAGEIKTADAGARARISVDGFELYNAGGTRTLHADAATGNVDMIGQLSSGTTGRRIVVNPEGTSDVEIRFYPSTGSEYAVLASWDRSGLPGTDAAVLLQTSENVSVHPEGVYSVVTLDTAIATFGRYTYVDADSLFYAQGGFVRAADDELALGYFDKLGTNDRGGYFQAHSDQARVGYLGAAANENYLDFDSTGITRHVGRWKDYVAVASNEGIFTGRLNFTGGETSVSGGYGPTMDSTMVPIVNIRDNVIHSSTLTGADTSGFTVDVSPAGSGAWSIYFWCFRV